MVLLLYSWVRHMESVVIIYQFPVLRHAKIIMKNSRPLMWKIAWHATAHHYNSPTEFMLSPLCGLLHSDKTETVITNMSFRRCNPILLKSLCYQHQVSPGSWVWLYLYPRSRMPCLQLWPLCSLFLPWLLLIHFFLFSIMNSTSQLWVVELNLT